MRRLGRWLIRALAVIGLVTVLVTAMGIAVGLRLAEEVEPALPERMILALDLEADFHEVASSDPFAQLSGRRTYVLRKVVEALDAAAADKRVTGLFATLGKTRLGLAGSQEIRDAVGRFRESGKPAVLFAETMGEFGDGTVDTYLASGFGQVWLQPSGDVGLTGIMLESPFVKGTLDLLGIRTQFAARHEYKSAIDIFTETQFTEPHRRNIDRLIESWTAQMAEGIAASRRLPPEQVRALLGKGPFLASEALSAGLVDRLGYRDEALKAIAGDGKPPKEVDAGDYARHLARTKGTKVALITGTGTIHRGTSQRGFGEPDDFAAASIAKAFREAVDDPAVKAILFRIDSPGGSYVASDVIWNEVRRARAAGKPVVASMGRLAASGGYFVAMGADRIIAQPGTITGSIGVFSGKAVLTDFWQKIGISWDEVHRGDNAAMWSTQAPFSPQAWERINLMMDRIYADFTGKAAQGRGIAPERMDELARGRVWTGADAKAAGLVDTLGGWPDSLAAVRELAKLPADAPLDLVGFPKPKRPWEVLADALSGSRDDAELRTLLRATRVLEPLARLAPLAEPATNTLRLPLEVAPP